MSEIANVAASETAGTPFRRVFVRVISVEVFVLLMLWALQARYSR